MSFEEAVSAQLKRVFFQESVYQPELYQASLDPRNIKYIYDMVVSRIGKSIGFDDFLGVSTEVLGGYLRDPYRPNTLLEAVSSLNQVWIDMFLKRFASEQNGAAAYYRKAAMQNFVQNPSEFQAPIASSIHGHRILVQSVGFGSTYENGAAESERIRTMYASGTLEKLFQ
jgi:hypothetical protein